MHEIQTDPTGCRSPTRCQHVPEGLEELRAGLGLYKPHTGPGRPRPFLFKPVLFFLKQCQASVFIITFLS